jgi:hypothetical protein
MSAPGPPPGWSSQPPYPPQPPGPPQPFPQPGMVGPPGRRRRSAAVVPLVILLVVVVGLGGGGAYLALHRGAYPKLMWACTLTPPAKLAAIVPHGLPKGDRPEDDDSESSCVWDNGLAVDAHLTRQDVHLTVRVTRYGISQHGGAEDTAHHWLRFRTTNTVGHSEGTPIPGYGDEAARLSKAFGGNFDAIVFRDSNLVIEVAAEIEDYPAPQPELAWNRTQQAAALVNQQLRIFRR